MNDGGRVNDVEVSSGGFCRLNLLVVFLGIIKRTGPHLLPSLSLKQSLQRLSWRFAGAGERCRRAFGFFAKVM